MAPDGSAASPLRAVVEVVVRALVDKPEAVRVNETERRGMTVLELTTAPGDMGKIIGRQGRTAAALRTLVALTAEKHGKRAQLEGLRAFQARAQCRTEDALAKLTQVARSGGNVFEELMETVKYASLGQISDALFRVGGRYRRAL